MSFHPVNRGNLRWKRATHEERLLLLAGVPSACWSRAVHPEFVGFSFVNDKDEKIKITREAQEEWAERLASPQELIEFGGLIVISGKAADDVALHLACSWVRDLILAGDQVGSLLKSTAKVINTDCVPEKFETDSSGRPVGLEWWRDAGACDAVVLHNVTATSGREHMAEVRNLLLTFGEITRVLVTAGEDPISTVVDRLHLRPDVVLFVRGERSRRVKR